MTKPPPEKGASAVNITTTKRSQKWAASVSSRPSRPTLPTKKAQKIWELVHSLIEREMLPTKTCQADNTKSSSGLADAADARWGALLAGPSRLSVSGSASKSHDSLSIGQHGSPTIVTGPDWETHQAIACQILFPDASEAGADLRKEQNVEDGQTQKLVETEDRYVCPPPGRKPEIQKKSCFLSRLLFYGFAVMAWHWSRVPRRAAPHHVWSRVTVETRST